MQWRVFILNTKILLFVQDGLGGGGNMAPVPPPGHPWGEQKLEARTVGLKPT